MPDLRVGPLRLLWRWRGPLAVAVARGRGRGRCGVRVGPLRLFWRWRGPLAVVELESLCGYNQTRPQKNWRRPEKRNILSTWTLLGTGVIMSVPTRNDGLTRKD